MIKLWSFIKGIAVQNETDRTKQLALEVDTTASSGTTTTLKSKQTLSRTLELPNVSGELVEKDAAQTLTNKTIDGDVNTVQDLALTSLKTVLADADKFVSRDVSGQVVSTKAVPTGTVVGNSDTQTLTNKTIDADLNTITNIENADIKTGAAIDAAKIHDGSVSNTEYGYLNGVTSPIQTQIDAKAELVGATDNRLIKSDGATDIQQTGITVDDSNNVTGVNDLTVDGNLTVNGTTTTVNTATLDVEDKNITVNFNGTDVTAEGAGLTVDRTGTSGSLVYEDAIASKWKAGILGSEVEVANVSSSQTLTNKNLASPTNILTGAKTDVFERATGNQNLVFIPDATLANDFVLNQHPQVISNKDIEGGTASNSNRLTIPNNTLSNLLALTRKEAVIVYGTDTDKLYVDDGSTLKEIGSGSGAKNFISNGDAEANTLGWTTYADAAGTRPIDGTGGTPSVTFTRSTSSPLEGQGSFLFTKDAVNRQGQGASYDFTIDAAYQAKVLTIEMDYVVSSGTFVAGSNSADSDVIVYIYDVTNSTLIEPSSIKFFSNSSTISDKFRATFQTSATGTNYRLIFHCASISASAYVLKIDNVKVSPSNYVYGTPISDWVSYTPTGTFTTNTTYVGAWRRVGDSLEGQVRLTFSGAPNAVTLTGISLPSGLVIDTATKAINSVCGIGSIFDNGVNRYSTDVYISSTTTVNPQIKNTAGTFATIASISNTSPFTIGSTDTIEISFFVPIVGWSSSVQMSDNVDTRITTANVAISGTQAVSTSTSANILLTTRTVESDTHGAFNTTTGFYVAPTSGFYRAKIRTNTLNTVYANASSYTAINIKRNNVTIDTISYYQASAAQTIPNQQHSGDRKVYLNAGDALIFEFSNFSGSSATLNHAYTEFEKLTGPSAIAASESINLRYSNTAGTSIAAGAGTSQVPYATKTYDTHNAWNGNTFTAPIAGKYRVTVSVFYASASFTAGSTISIQARVNGTATNFIGILTKQASFTSGLAQNGSDVINLLAGDTLDIQLSHNEGTARSLATTANTNYICIERIGN